MDHHFQLAPVESATLTVLIDNTIDIFMPDEGPAVRGGLSAAMAARTAARYLVGGEAPDQLVAEHGFSLLVDVTLRSGRHRFLFDTGVSPDGLIDNMTRLDIAHDSMEAIVLSHGHFDHTTGLDGLARAVGPARLPVVIHPELWSRRRICLPGREPWELPSTSKRALEDTGFEITESRRPSLLFRNSLLVTGEIDRTTSFEKGFPIQQAWKGGQWVDDPLVLDDQAIVLSVADRGLVVITGCGHAGVVNTVRHAQRLTGIDSIYAVIGGFHLSGPMFEPSIPATVKSLRELAPAVLVPTHCTGWRAITALAGAFPNAFVPSTVGSMFRL